MRSLLLLVDRAFGAHTDAARGDDEFALLIAVIWLKEPFTKTRVAAVLLAAGTPGKRFALPHSRILIHQPYTEGGGQASDVEIQANEILRMRAEMEGILALHTGKTPEAIEKDIERDKILTADAAKEYGIIDAVIASRKA